MSLFSIKWALCPILWGLNCLHYLPSTWTDDLWSAQHPSHLKFFGHFIWSLAEHIQSSCSCSFPGLWPRMFGLSQRALCCHKGNLFNWNLSLQFSFQTWFGKLTKCSDKHPGAPYRFMFLRTVYNFQEDLSLEPPSLLLRAYDYNWCICCLCVQEQHCIIILY